MVLGVLHLNLLVPDAMSLKDKRRVIKGLKDRIAARHNVSVAEIDHLDAHRRAEVAVVMVSNERRFTDSCLSKIVDEVRGRHGVEILDYDIEWL